MSKVFVPNEMDDDKLRTLAVLLSNIQRVRHAARRGERYSAKFVLQRRPIHDTAAKNALERFEKALHKKFAEKLEGVSEEDYRKLEHLSQLFEFLDAMPEVEEDEEAEPPKKRAPRGTKCVGRCRF